MSKEERRRILPPMTKGEIVDLDFIDVNMAIFRISIMM